MAFVPQENKLLPKEIKLHKKRKLSMQNIWHFSINLRQNYHLSYLMWYREGKAPWRYLRTSMHTYIFSIICLFHSFWSCFHQLLSEWVKVTQSCPSLCDPMDYTVHGILQARILEWVAFPFSRGSSQPRDWTQVSCITGRFFTSWATREVQEYWSG